MKFYHATRQGNVASILTYGFKTSDWAVEVKGPDLRDYGIERPVFFTQTLKAAWDAAGIRGTERPLAVLAVEVPEHVSWVEDDECCGDDLWWVIDEEDLRGCHVELVEVW